MIKPSTASPPTRYTERKLGVVSNSSQHISGKSSSHNKYSAHLPHSRPKSADSVTVTTTWQCPRPFLLVLYLGQPPREPESYYATSPASISGHVLIRGQSQYLYFPVFYYFVCLERIDNYKSGPFSPNLVNITHCWRKLSGTWTSFQVATETLSSSGSSPAIQDAIVLGAPPWATIGPECIVVILIGQWSCLKDATPQLIACVVQWLLSLAPWETFRAFQLIYPSAIPGDYMESQLVGGGSWDPSPAFWDILSIWQLTYLRSA